jgi:hypothetical protein
MHERAAERRGRLEDAGSIGASDSPPGRARLRPRGLYRAPPKRAAPLGSDPCSWIYDAKISSSDCALRSSPPGERGR